MVLRTLRLPRCSCNVAVISSSSCSYAAFSAPSRATGMTSSRYAGSASEMSSSETKAQVSIRYLPKSSGDAPGLRRIVTSVLFFLEQALSSILVRSMVSITPNSWVKRSLPAEPQVNPSRTMRLASTRKKGVIEIVGIAAQKSAGEAGDFLCHSCQHTESVALCRVSSQLMRSEEHTSELQSRPHLVCR